MKQYSEYMSPENIDQLRERLITVMHKHNLTMHQVGQAIDISHMTVKKFIANKGPVIFLIIMKIENYVIEMESK